MERPILTVLLTLLGVALGFVLALASFPYVLWALGRSMLGDEPGYARAMEASPLWRYLEWIDGRPA